MSKYHFEDYPRHILRTVLHCCSVSVSVAAAVHEKSQVITNTVQRLETVLATSTHSACQTTGRWWIVLVNASCCCIIYSPHFVFPIPNLTPARYAMLNTEYRVGYAIWSTEKEPQKRRAPRLLCVIKIPPDPLKKKKRKKKAQSTLSHELSCSGCFHLSYFGRGNLCPGNSSIIVHPFGCLFTRSPLCTSVSIQRISLTRASLLLLLTYQTADATT